MCQLRIPAIDFFPRSLNTINFCPTDGAKNFTTLKLRTEKLIPYDMTTEIFKHVLAVSGSIWNYGTKPEVLVNYPFPFDSIWRWSHSCLWASRNTLKCYKSTQDVSPLKSHEQRERTVTDCSFTVSQSGLSLSPRNKPSVRLKLCIWLPYVSRRYIYTIDRLVDFLVWISQTWYLDI